MTDSASLAGSTSDRDGRRALELFERALDRTAEEREAFLLGAAGDDRALARRLLALLERHRDEQSLPGLVLPVGATGPGPDVGGEVSESFTVGRFQVVDRIGEGGMGTVYLAEQREPVKRRVALKVLKPGLCTDDVVARFEAERQALALMDHAHIAKVFDGGVTTDGRPYFAMEYVAGEPLTEYCDSRRLSLAERVRLFVEVCGAVQHAHQKGIIHRDLKPSNVLVASEDGAPRVIDFGIAKAVGLRLTEETLQTRHGLLVGTPEYMSPEQAEGGATDIDTRSDVYSLGVLLHELLIGRLPWDRDVLRGGGLSEALRVLREDETPRPSTRFDSLPGDERSEVARTRRTTEPEIRRDLGRDLDWIVLRALEKDRERRYPSASELAADLERYLRGEVVAAGPPTLRYRVVKFVNRHRLGVAGAAGLVLVLLGSALAFGAQAARLRAALGEAREQTLLAEGVSRLLLDAFRDADPTERSVDHEVTAREVLERGAERLQETDLAPEVRASLSTSMASAYLGLGEVEGAADLARRALLAAEQVGGESLARALLINYEVSKVRLQYEESTRFAERAVEVTQREGLRRLRVEALLSLASSLMVRGRYEEGEAILAQADLLGREVPGLERETVARGLDLRAQNAIYLSEFERGLELAQRSYDELVALASNPLRLVGARQTVATILSEMGRPEEALEWDRGSYELADERLGSEHYRTRALRNNYALRLNNLSHLDRALELFEQSIDISKRVDPGGADITYELNNLGLVLQGLGRLEEAEAAFREALEKQYAVVGHDHPNPGYHLMNLGRVLQEQGRYAEAEASYLEARALWQRVLSNDHALVGNVKVWLGALWVELGRAEEARPLLEEGVRIRTRDRGLTDWQTAEARSWLGAALAELGESEEARPLIVDTLAVVREQRGDRWRRTRWASRRVLGFYDLIGDLEAFESHAEDHEKRYGQRVTVDRERRWASG